VQQYDSETEKDKQDPMLGAVFGPLMKVAIVITVGPDGKVRSVAGLDEMWGELKKQVPAAADVIDQMSNSMGNEMVKELIEDMAWWTTS
ncbi:MAG: DUF6263 family protein, partial [Planctomycetota bacterium]